MAEPSIGCDVFTFWLVIDVDDVAHLYWLKDYLIILPLVDPSILIINFVQTDSLLSAIQVVAFIDSFNLIIKAIMYPIVD